MSTEELKYFEECLIKFYGEENVGQFEWLDIKGLAVHFDELLITTSDNRYQHLIRDIYFVFENDLYIRCCRGTQTDMEYIRGYYHSHAPRNTEGGFFCLGVSPYSRIAQDINLGKNVKLNLQALVIAFNEMIRVESKEGVPYCNIENLKKGYNREISIHTTYFDTCTFETLGRLLNKVKKEDLVTLITFLNFLIREDFITGEHGSYKYAIVNNIIYETIKESDTKKLDTYQPIKYKFKGKELTSKLLKGEISYTESIRLLDPISFYYRIWQNLVALI